MRAKDIAMLVLSEVKRLSKEASMNEIDRV